MVPQVSIQLKTVRVEAMSFGKKFLLALIVYWLPAIFLFVSRTGDLLTFTAFAAAVCATFGYFLSLVGLAGYYGGWRGTGGGYTSPERISLEQSNPTAANSIDQMPSYKNQAFGQTILHIISVYAMWIAVYATAFLLMSNGIIPAQSNNNFYFNILGLAALVWFLVSWGVRKLNQNT